MTVSVHPTKFLSVVICNKKSAVLNIKHFANNVCFETGCIVYHVVEHALVVCLIYIYIYDTTISHLQFLPK